MDQFLNLQQQQQYEQTMAAIQQMAAVIHQYHDNLIAQGFGRRQAMALTLALQHTFIANAKNSDGA